MRARGSGAGASTRALTVVAAAANRDKYIFPIGYCSARLYVSMVDPTRKVYYRSRIVDGGSAPKVRERGAVLRDRHRAAADVWRRRVPAIVRSSP